MSKKPVIGIDLGTTNSCVAIMESGKPIVINNPEGKRTTPSIVGFTRSGEILVGDSAKRQAVTNPSNTIYSAKRFIGANYEDRLDEAKRVPYKVVKHSTGSPGFDVSGKVYSPQEISARVLQTMKKAAEDYLGQSVEDAVITVPAYFSDSQRQATKDAAKIAGLNVLRLVNEPTAAALAYGMDKKRSGKIMVTDVGGGTTDFSCLEISDDVIEVLSTSGDSHLAGDNLDEVLVEFLLKTFKDDTGIDISKDPMAMQRLKDSAEKAKIELSSSLQTDINLPFLTADQTGPKHLNIQLSRAQFEKLIEPLIEKMFAPCFQALKDAKLKPEEIDEVILVGGSTRVPLIQQKVKEIFKKEPSKGVNPDEVVALGAAVQGGVLSGDVTDILLLDVTPLSLGIETVGGVMTRVIERNTTIPVKKTQVFSTAADNQSAVTVKVLQGERAMAADNMELATFTLGDIPMAPRGVPQIQIEFSIDANGILNVSAKDLGTGKEQSVTVSNSTKLDEKEIERMMKEAELNAEKDQERKQFVEAKNGLDSLIFNTEKMLKDLGEKADETLKKEVEDSLALAKEKIQTAELGELKSLTEDLQTKTHKLAEQLYKASATSQESEPEQTTENQNQ